MREQVGPSKPAVTLERQNFNLKEKLPSDTDLKHEFQENAQPELCGVLPVNVSWSVLNIVSNN